MNKKTERFLKREAREERRYGDPILRKMAENDPSVGRHYARYKNARKQGDTSLIMVAVFLALGVLSLIMLVATQSMGWGYAFGFQSLVAFYWLSEYKQCCIREELATFKLIYFADSQVAIDAYYSVKGQENGNDKTTTVD